MMGIEVVGDSQWIGNLPQSVVVRRHISPWLDSKRWLLGPRYPPEPEKGRGIAFVGHWETENSMPSGSEYRPMVWHVRWRLMLRPVRTRAYVAEEDIKAGRVGYPNIRGPP